MKKNGSSDPVTDIAGRRMYGRNLGLLPLHEAALKLAGLGLNKSHSKTRDLVAMLLSHGARAWRGNQPHAVLHLHVTSQGRRPAVRMRVR